MKLANTRRLVASLLLGSMATTLAACGLASAPVMPMPTGNAAALARKAPDTGRTFGTTMTADMPKVKFVAGSLASNVPPAADIRIKMSPVDDQGRIGSCTAFAVTGLAEFRARQAGNTEELSPGFIYLMNLKEQDSVGQATGASVTTGLTSLNKYGICPERLHPYLAPTEQTNPASVTAFVSQLPSAEAMQAALPNRLPGATRIGDINGLKTAIAGGKPVIFAIDVYKSFMGARDGHIPLPSSDEERLGGHAIVAVGYNDTTKQIAFRNSWGPKWGDSGYGYLPYDYFRSGLARDAWTIK
jgi:C1A family cysteine protease